MGKKRILSFILALVCTVSLITIVPENAEAKTINSAVSKSFGNLYLSGNGVQIGKYIYYAKPNEIIKINTSTGNKKTIFTDDKANFSDLQGKGDYLYFTWNINGIDSDAICYKIYRIRKNGKELKEIADGSDFVIKDNNLIYTHREIGKDDYGYDSNAYIDSIRSISMDGKDDKILVTTDRLWVAGLLDGTVLCEDSLNLGTFSFIDGTNAHNSQWFAKRNFITGGLNGINGSRSIFYIKNTGKLIFTRKKDSLLDGISFIPFKGNGSKERHIKWSKKVFSIGKASVIGDYILVVDYKAAKQGHANTELLLYTKDLKKIKTVSTWYTV